jgi:hypothetical protein
VPSEPGWRQSDATRDGVNRFVAGLQHRDAREDTLRGHPPGRAEARGVAESSLELSRRQTGTLSQVGHPQRPPETLAGHLHRRRDRIVAWQVRDWSLDELSLAL